MRISCFVPGYTAGYKKSALKNKLNVTPNKSTFKASKVSDI